MNAAGVKSGDSCTGMEGGSHDSAMICGVPAACSEVPSADADAAALAVVADAVAAPVVRAEVVLVLPAKLVPTLDAVEVARGVAPANARVVLPSEDLLSAAVGVIRVEPADDAVLLAL